MWNQAVEGADQCSLTTTASPSQENKFSGLYRHINASEGKVFAFLVAKTKILKRDLSYPPQDDFPDPGLVQKQQSRQEEYPQ